MCRSRPAGSSFRNLGINFDTRLLMHDGISDCVRECGWRVHNILRNRRFYTDSETILFYKSHVLSYIEYRTAAFHFASSSALAPLDAVQSRFLRAVLISDSDSLMHFALAPLSTRRDIAMLGIIHRSVLGKGPPLLHQFFRLDLASPPPRAPPRHSRHLVDPCGLRSPDYLLNSALGSVRIYNLLPNSVVRAKSVNNFQSSLQLLLRGYLCSPSSALDWQYLFSPRTALAHHPLRHSRNWRPPA